MANALSVLQGALPAGGIRPLDFMLGAYVRAAVEAHHGNKSHAAKALGIDRRSVYRYLAKTKGL